MAAQPSKKQKTSGEWMTEHCMNINAVVDKPSHKTSLHELAASKPDVLMGLGEKSEELLEALGVSSVSELAAWKYGKWAHSIVVLAQSEVTDKREKGSMMNLDNCLDKAHEAKSLKDILALPCSALEGLTAKADEALKVRHIDTVGKLGHWKYLEVARAISVLAEVEETQTPEERHAAREAAKLA